MEGYLLGGYIGLEGRERRGNKQKNKNNKIIIIIKRLYLKINLIILYVL